jgi:dUTP pyrophosphatase
MALADTALDQLQVRLLRRGAQPPARTRPGDAGYDLRCAEGFSLWPGERATVPTGVAIALPPGIAGLVTPRSGLAARHGISLPNAPGLIDAGYRGEVRVLLLNTDRSEPFEVSPGDRIAQLVIARVESPDIHEVASLEETTRGAGGFGSTGR